MIRLTTEQAQQIEEALEDIVRVFTFETGTPVEALATIRAARAQGQAEQEPVAKVVLNKANQITMQKPNGDYFDISKHVGEYFYAAPQPVQQIDLTDDEIVSVLEYYDHEWDETTFAIARAVITADRELNR